MHESGTNPRLQMPYDHDYYSELCALATSGSLNDTEWEQLKRHLSKCPRCTQELREYREIARTGMAMLMPDCPADAGISQAWSVESAKQDLFARIARGEAGPYSGRRDPAPQPARKAWWPSWSQPARHPAMAYAAIVLVCITTVVSAFELGTRRGQRTVSTVQNDPHLAIQLRQMIDRRNALEASNDARSNELEKAEEQLFQQNQEIEKYKTLTARLATELQSQKTGFGSLQGQYESISADRDLVSHKLQDSEATLHSLEKKFDELRAQQTGDSKTNAVMEARIAELSSRLKDAEGNVRQQQEFLAADRDVRELMGARNLYIADVYDVNRKGETEKPYGRVFYTAGKSLIFYAFDLDLQPHVRDAGNFQLWGRRGLADRRPLNMGIFYLDSAANKRWVLKFDNPDALAKIDAVFVTVEPRGGSEKPSGKQLLFASLRNVVSNHP